MCRLLRLRTKVAYPIPPHVVKGCSRLAFTIDGGLNPARCQPFRPSHTRRLGPKDEGILARIRMENGAGMGRRAARHPAFCEEPTDLGSGWLPTPVNRMLYKPKMPQHRDSRRVFVPAPWVPGPFKTRLESSIEKLRYVYDYMYDPTRNLLNFINSVTVHDSTTIRYPGLSAPPTSASSARTARRAK